VNDLIDILGKEDLVLEDQKLNSHIQHRNRVAWNVCQILAAFEEILHVSFSLSFFSRTDGP
jgi:hypothetical protein